MLKKVQKIIKFGCDKIEDKVIKLANRLEKEVK